MDDASEFVQGIAGSFGAAEAAMGQDMYQSTVAANNGHAAMLEAQTDAVYANTQMAERYSSAAIEQRKTVTGLLQTFGVLGTITWIIVVIHVTYGWMR